MSGAEPKTLRFDERKTQEYYANLEAMQQLRRAAWNWLQTHDPNAAAFLHAINAAFGKPKRLHIEMPNGETLFQNNLGWVKQQKTLSHEIETQKDERDHGPA